MLDWEAIVRTERTTRLPVYQDFVRDAYIDLQESGAREIRIQVLQTQVILIGKFEGREEVHKFFIPPEHLRRRWPWTVFAN